MTSPICPTSSLQPLPPGNVPSAKRQKVTRACDSCKARKRRCTGELPCKSCSASGGDCNYTAAYTRGKLVDPVPARYGAGRSNGPAEPSARPAAAVTGVQLGTKRDREHTDDSGNHSRTSRAASPEGDPAALTGQYSGPSSAYSFLRRAWRRFGLESSQKEEAELSQSVPIFQYGDRQYPRGNDDPPFVLPDRETTAELLSIYFDFAMPTYRFLHQPTVCGWLEIYQEQTVALLPARQAVVLMVLATAALLKSHNDDQLENWHASEPYFHAAQAAVAGETGKPRVESVQARLAMCLYLLHTSRPNQAWYTFPNQLILSLGMHRARASTAPQLDTITSECRKRAFWTAFGLDTWLSCILGRPALIHIDDVDQEYPAAVDDDEIAASGIVPAGLRRDPVMQGSICHAKVTRIVKKALREQYSVQRHKDGHRLNIATKLNIELGTWKASLPVILSGQVHPSSLIQIFQRQIIVLQMVHSLALILINRPLLLIESAGNDIKSNIATCMSAAKTVLDIVLGFISDRKIFEAFWYTQYVTFNALSVVYVWLIQRRRARLIDIELPHNDEELYQLAQTIQRHLTNATSSNAPSLRYSIILEELYQETHRLMSRFSKARPPHMSGLVEAPTESHPYATPVNRADGSASSQRSESFGVDTSFDFPLDHDLWLQLDAYPFSDLDFERLV